MNSSLFRLLALVFLFLIIGCGPGCPDYAPDPNLGRHGVWLRNPDISFVDSGNNELTLLFKESKIERIEGYTSNGCPDNGFDYTEARVITFFSPDHNGFTVTDNARYGISFPDFSTYGSVSVLDSVVQYQGKTYEDGRYYSRTDSTDNLIYEVYFSNIWGLVMFGYKNEYHWERVLD